MTFIPYFLRKRRGRNLPVLQRLFRRRKPRVFLGAISVLERTDLKRHLELERFAEGEPLNQALHRTLTEIFALPSVAAIEDPMPTDLAIDVWIAKFQAGEVVDIDIMEFGVALLWRPKVTVASRLYALATNKTKTTFKVTEKMPWGQFLGRVLSLQGLFGAQPSVRGDMEHLLCQACARLLVKLQKAV